MRLHKSTEYSLRCLIYMARRPERLCTVKEMSNALAFPYKFLGHLMRQLGAADIVQAVRGKHGGYHLARPAQKITLHDVVYVVEGGEDAQRCILGFDSCSDEDPCAMHQAWAKTRNIIEEMEHSITLASLAKGSQARE